MELVCLAHQAQSERRFSGRSSVVTNYYFYSGSCENTRAVEICSCVLELDAFFKLYLFV